MRVILTPLAEQDAVDIGDEMIHQASAEAFDAGLETLLARLAEFPWSGAPREDIRPGLRASVLGDFVVFHRVLGETVWVLRVLSGRQDVEVELR